jgi:hypothetical protein
MKKHIKDMGKAFFQCAYEEAENEIEEMKIISTATEYGISLKLKENYEVNFTNKLLEDHFHVEPNNE